ncbi:hypothetical protein [Nocardia transvalensis]|uniref:hypothetical protein n=1 Tax=Nocardia transvalensis TaxID=37333 RepID=UPI00189402DA|nr:hypothetical protein [Nocardia transvalensis]MBF6328116.1 hypothetical protein [Nocardia transvalensis]
MLDERLLFPNAEQLQRAFRGDTAVSASADLTGASSAMIPLHRKRSAAIQLMRQPDLVSGNQFRAAVRDLVATEGELTALAATIDRTVARILQGRRRVSGVWHAETVGMVISRMAELWLNYLDSNRHQDAFWIARISDAYNCLIADLATGPRLPPDM